MGRESIENIREDIRNRRVRILFFDSCAVIKGGERRKNTKQYDDAVIQSKKRGDSRVRKKKSKQLFSFRFASCYFRRRGNIHLRFLVIVINVFRDDDCLRVEIQRIIRL